MKMNGFDKLTAGGFTLIETLVAVSILALAVAGPLTSASRAIVAAQTAKDQLTASHLAQEGIEYVRLMRDNAYLAEYAAGFTGSSWTDFLNATAQCHTPKICTLGLIQGDGTLPVTSCPSGNACTTPFSLLSNGTLFTRTIQTIDATTNDERIISKVTWKNRGSYTVQITDHLTPWQ